MTIMLDSIWFQSMLSKRYLWSDFKIATEQYRDCIHQRDSTLKALGLCYEALAKGALNGRKEQSMIVRIKELNGVLFNQTIMLCKLEKKIERAKRSKL